MKREKLNKDKKVKYSIATYVQPDGRNVVDLKELAQKIDKWEMGPEKLNFTRASEIVLLAREYLYYRKKENKK